MNEENFYYYGKHKQYRQPKLVCPQTVVDTKDDLLKLRIEPALKKRIKELSKLKNKSASEMTRLLWQNYFKKYDELSWQQECKEMFG